MKLLLGSIAVAAMVASAATVSARPDSAADATAMSRSSSPFEINRSAKVDRLPIVAAGVRVKTLAIRAGKSRDDGLAFTDPINCDAVVSPIASASASRRLRQCMT